MNMKRRKKMTREFHKKQSLWLYNDKEAETLYKLTFDLTNWEISYDEQTNEVISINKISKEEADG
jgi:hypothetical protein